LVVDAVFGTGLSRPLSGIYAHAIGLICRSGARVLSCDVPSGIDADTGQIMGAAVRADVTLMLGLAKPACRIKPGCDYFGEIRLADIGLPEKYKREE
jgi:NAD(P)H-hydrate epimerase